MICKKNYLDCIKIVIKLLYFVIFFQFNNKKVEEFLYKFLFSKFVYKKGFWNNMIKN